MDRHVSLFKYTKSLQICFWLQFNIGIEYDLLTWFVFGPWIIQLEIRSAGLIRRATVMTFQPSDNIWFRFHVTQIEN